eukprot:6504330-Prymnesium_polylepis.1
MGVARWRPRSSPRTAVRGTSCIRSSSSTACRAAAAAAAGCCGPQSSRTTQRSPTAAPRHDRAAQSGGGSQTSRTKRRCRGSTRSAGPGSAGCSTTRPPACPRLSKWYAAATRPA